METQNERNKLCKKKWREEHRDEIREKRRQAYRDEVLEKMDHFVVPTVKKLNPSGIDRQILQNRLSVNSDIIHKRHVIERRLEMNQIRAEQFKKLLSGENV
jgi:hypothetical protein